MNTKKTAITIVAAMMAIAMITVAMAAICDEPCGTKVTQCTDDAPTKDAVYALILPGFTGAGILGTAVPAMRVGYVDLNGNNAFDTNECAYVDTNSAAAIVQAGDVRLTECCQCPANTVVGECTCTGYNEIGTLTYTNQRIVGYVDMDVDGVYSLPDLLYLDMDGGTGVPGDGFISEGDIRLTEAFGHSAYSIVANGDDDAPVPNPAPIALFDPATNAGTGTLGATLFNDYLGFVDSSCDGQWTPNGEDKLYLQQLVLWPADANARINQFDAFVTIGDFRLYMPPAETCWPDCGTKVMQCDPDAVYALLIPDGVTPTNPAGALVPAMEFRWVDTQPNGIFDQADNAYVNTDGAGINVEAGDVRLTECCGCDPNTMVGVCGNCDLLPISPFVPRTQQDVVGYVDMVDAHGIQNGVYDLNDPLYLDVGGMSPGVAGPNFANGVVSPGDIRLTDAFGYDAWSVVVAGNTDCPLTGGLPLRDPVLNIPMTPVVDDGTLLNELLGFVDSECNYVWDTDADDKLYLQQAVDELGAAQNGWQNWGFEMGDLTNWVVLAGNVDVLDANDFAPNIPVPEGRYYALLSTGPGVTVGPSIQNRDAALGFERDIAVLQRTFVVPAGAGPSVMTIQLDFLTSAQDVPLANDDIFQVTLDGVPIALAPGRSVDQPAASSPWPDYGAPGYDGVIYNVINGVATAGSTFDDGRVGFATFTVPMPVAPGPHVLQFYLGDQGNDWADSGLLIDIVVRAPADDFATIGDLRLFIDESKVGSGPDEPCWLKCGTKVEECDVDAVYALAIPGVTPQTPTGGPVSAMQFGFVDKDGNGAFMLVPGSTTVADCAYIDTNIVVDITSNTGFRVAVGDIRLSTCCDEVPNTVVEECDLDEINQELRVPGAGWVWGQVGLVGYVDTNTDPLLPGYDVSEPLYLDCGGSVFPLTLPVYADGMVSAGDIRLTGRTDMNYPAWSVVQSGDADQLGSVNSILLDPRTDIPTVDFLNGFVNGGPTFNDYLGFRDSNCTGIWDIYGGDELYLQQLVPAPDLFMTIPLPNDAQFNLFSTIGDFRIYMPPGSGPTYNQFDANQDCEISITEMGAALDAWYAGTIGIAEMGDVLDLWYQGTYC